MPPRRALTKKYIMQEMFKAKDLCWTESQIRDDESGRSYPIHQLTHASGRIVAGVFKPPDYLSYTTRFWIDLPKPLYDDASETRFIDLEPAKRYVVSLVEQVSEWAEEMEAEEPWMEEEQTQPVFTLQIWRLVFAVVWKRKSRSGKSLETP